MRYLCVSTRGQTAPLAQKFEAVYYYLFAFHERLHLGAGHRGRRLSCARDGLLQSFPKWGARPIERSELQRQEVEYLFVHYIL